MFRLFGLLLVGLVLKDTIKQQGIHNEEYIGEILTQGLGHVFLRSILKLLQSQQALSVMTRLGR